MDRNQLPASVGAVVEGRICINWPSANSAIDTIGGGWVRGSDVFLQRTHGVPGCMWKAVSCGHEMVSAGTDYRTDIHSFRFLATVVDLPPLR